jgi:hypothetical protein
MYAITKRCSVKIMLHGWNIWQTKRHVNEMSGWHNVSQIKCLIDKMSGGWKVWTKCLVDVMLNGQKVWLSKIFFLFHCSFWKLEHFRAYVKLFPLFKRSSLIFILAEKETMAEKKSFEILLKLTFYFVLPTLPLLWRKVT